jgi:hypothetical protein
MENYDIIEEAEDRIRIGSISRQNPLRVKLPRYITRYETINKQQYDELKKNFIESAILYEGDPNNCDIKHYKSKIELLQKSLKQFGLLIDYIWYSKTAQGTKIIGRSPDENIMWTVNTCSSWGSNYIYINKRQIKLSSWLNMTDIERKKFFDEAMGF